VGVNSGPPYWACVVRHGTVELRAERYTVPDGQTTHPAKKGVKHTQSLSPLSPDVGLLTKFPVVPRMQAESRAFISCQ
jgi:hypothetical protein